MIRAPGTPEGRRKRYVCEPIVVMEEMLGRSLLPGSPSATVTAYETTTGERAWSYGPRPQPAGIRATDAVAWARQILEQCGGLDCTSNNAQGLH
jgi:hypothetical protein